MAKRPAKRVAIQPTLREVATEKETGPAPDNPAVSLSPDVETPHKPKRLRTPTNSVESLSNLGFRKQSRSKTGRIRIPVSGLVSLTRLELQLIDCESFQRLRKIRQLGGTYIVYPGATHSRFEHSIGAVDTAQRMLDAIKKNTGVVITEDDEKRVRLGALLHDIGHLPYGHTLEDEVGIFGKHDDKARLDTLLGVNSEIREVFVENSEEKTLLDVQALLDKKASEKLPPEKMYWADIVSNTICADLLDYLRRDFHHLGFRSDYDDHIYEYMTLASDTEGRTRFAISLVKSGKARPDAVSMILAILELRYMLAESVLFHHAKDCHSAMLSRALLESHFLVELMDSKDSNRGIEAKYAKVPGSQIELYFSSQDGSQRIEEPKLLGLGDDDLIACLVEDEDECASTLARMVQDRQLYAPVMTISYEESQKNDRQAVIIAETHHSAARKHHLERQIETELGLPRGSVLFYTPSGEMNSKIAKVHVVAGGNAIPLADYERDKQDPLTGGFLRAQIRRFHRLWRSYVFAHPAVSAGDKKLIGKYVRAHFGLGADTYNPKDIARSRDEGFRDIAVSLVAGMNPDLTQGDLESAKASRFFNRSADDGRPVGRFIDALVTALED